MNYTIVLEYQVSCAMSKVMGRIVSFNRLMETILANCHKLLKISVKIPREILQFWDYNEPITFCYLEFTSIYY